MSPSGGKREGAGRPRMDVRGVRDHNLTISILEAQREKLERLSAASDTSIAQVVSKLIDDAPEPKTKKAK